MTVTLLPHTVCTRECSQAVFPLPWTAWEWGYIQFLKFRGPEQTYSSLIFRGASNFQSGTLAVFISLETCGCRDTIPIFYQLQVVDVTHLRIQGGCHQHIIFHSHHFFVLEGGPVIPQDKTALYPAKGCERNHQLILEIQPRVKFYWLEWSGMYLSCQLVL